MNSENETPEKAHTKADLPMSDDRIQRQLQRILDSPEFQATSRQREFLQFVVSETLAGREQEIKGFTVATHVFGRGEDFNQATDPIVSIQANQLRRALERYYLVAGGEDPIRIDIPKGTYVPVFHEQIAVNSDEIVLDERGPDPGVEGSWPSVLVQPFDNLTGDPGLNFLGVGLATELTVELSRYQEIQVLMCRPEGDTSMTSPGVARFVIDGSVRRDREGIKVTVQMVDAKTNTQIWGDTHRSNLDATELIAFEEEVARVISAKTAGERGIIAKTLSPESRNKPPAELKTYEALLRYYEYEQTLSLQSALRAFEALEYAAGIEPECGAVWSMLGRLYGNIYSLEFPGFETALEKAIAYAEKGVQLNPDDQRARAILALIRMFSNEIPAALAEVERAWVLNPNSLLALDGIGYLLTLLGEWERGPALIRKVIRLNPYYREVVHYALWEDWIRQEEYERAYAETMNIKTPAVFWYPLAKASTSGLLGRYEEGKKFVENLLQLKPDFPSRGRVLIGHYIKFKDILERTVEGLRKSGLNLETD